MRHSNSELSHERASFASSVHVVCDSASSSHTLCGRPALASSCRICLSAIFRPAALTCGHRFCERCLAQYWRVGQKPACIVCPLCRACAFNVDFTKEDKGLSSEDFRKTFSPIVVKELDMCSAVAWCAKISALMPAIYFLLKWLKPGRLELLQLFKNFYLTLASKM